MPPNREEENAITREHVVKIACCLGIALLDTFRGPTYSADDRKGVIDRWGDLANSICDFGEYLDDSA